MHQWEGAFFLFGIFLEFQLIRNVQLSALSCEDLKTKLAIGDAL